TFESATNAVEIVTEALSIICYSEKLLQLEGEALFQSAGNDAFQSGKFIKAVEHYTNSIMRSIESRHFAAICLRNRVVAHQSLGNFLMPLQIAILP
ncbi:DnaJ domain, zinc finger, CCHC-type, tetratricopeptide-like helical domain protein, partial [Tanacetum coccineum]